ncbi:protein mono-ADP-ribosyltransferase PARP10 [Lampris incognitus]|uniref:protein mono-ADP-ribosyltransferase PARP10 n=1 Tax=Lampris incognitus TaxID=2546036 RepID=UPI0024B5F6EF|nr:protein mono-ADP-ribosyltransferase PARP10 [Lampris incognitus]XP_056154746.1 protein mono-ADP-ribosyltransferase PARP10 [Lampris incognitus]
MPVENLDKKTVEVLGVPEGVSEELLSLYFENTRRSRGGPLLSVHKEGDHAVIVFKEAEVAVRVLSKRPHILNNVQLTVREPASKDQRRMLLRGINPSTNMELVELYVENMMGIDVKDYTLYPSPGRDLILIHLCQPLSIDFQRLSTKISNKPLDGCKIILEQIDQTDSVVVENLHPGTDIDMLTLYFESKQGGDQRVKEIMMISERSAKVSFVNFNSVDHVLNRPHKLMDAELKVEPYAAFVQSIESPASQNSENGFQDGDTDNNPQNLTRLQERSSSPTAVPVNSQATNHTASDSAIGPVAAAEVAEEVMEDLTDGAEMLSNHIAVPDQVKLSLFQISSLHLDIQKSHPNIKIHTKDNGVDITGPDKVEIDQLQDTILEFLSGIAEIQLTLDLEKSQFLENADVKERLVGTMNEIGLPAVYSVTDSVVVLSSPSLNLANQASVFLQSQLCTFNITVDKEYECMLYSNEWSGFIQSLRLCTVRVSERGGELSVLTLKGLENEKQTQILKFLSTPIERETVISMEPGMLKYMQIHCHQLLADMDQVSIFPIEEDKACGLRIHGNAGACQMADEVLQGVVSSVCTRTITVNAPGVARFLVGEESTGILGEMQTKFQVYISLEKVHWEPLQNEDIFETAWKMISLQNLHQVPLDGLGQGIETVLPQTDQMINQDGALGRGLIEEAKKIVSAIDENMEVGQSSYNTVIDMDEEDLYTAGEPTDPSDQGTDVACEDALRAIAEGNVAGGSLLSGDGTLGLPPIDLEEEAQLSLAIQYSMEYTKRCPADEEEELQKVLEMSKETIRHKDLNIHGDKSSLLNKPSKTFDVSLQDAIQAANTAQISVFAGYSCDLIRVDIALGKRITLRQVEEKFENQSLKSMSELHKICLDVIKRHCAVDIQIHGNIVTISGFKDYVDEALPYLKRLLKSISSTMSDSEILRTVQWVRQEQDSTATPYAPNTTVFLENAWKMKQKRLDILLNNQPHIINFEKMQEYSISTGKSLKISRKMLGSLDLSSEVPEEDYSLLSSLPEATRVDEGSDEFQNVVKDFYETIQEYHSKIRIVKVEKLMNQLLYNQYRLKKASISQSATQPEVEQTLYHGTSEASVKEICIHGFNRSFCGKNATVYGQGVYFAVNSALSVQDQYSPPNTHGHKFVFVAKVLTGDYTKGCHSMKTAPLKESADIPLRYDSVADNISKPSLFVIFNDTQAYPEYLITCQKIHY